MQVTSYQYGDARRHLTPGVSFEEATPRKVAEFRTGVPAFLGFAQVVDERPFAGSSRSYHSVRLTGWDQFDERLRETPVWGFLRDAVRGFFENGGSQCVVVTLPLKEPVTGAPQTPSAEELRKALEVLDSRADVDLVCFPDLSAGAAQMIELQSEILRYCSETSRFAILDAPPSHREAAARIRAANAGDLEKLKKHWHDLPGADGAEGALYYPWIRVRQAAGRWVPPCGHVAGIFARSDGRIGVHKAPANEIVEGAVDLEIQLDDRDQGELNDAGVNCLRALPGRGIRVWGARTLCGLPEWRYVPVRRLFLTLMRWIDQSFGDLVFEPNTPLLWERIRGRLNAFCYDLFQQGALNGGSPEEAYQVKCDGELNPPEEREAGRVISQVGLAAIAPAEFIVVRIAHSAAGATFAGSTGPQQERR
jgi:phage tail sheath protein FI